MVKAKSRVVKEFEGDEGKIEGGEEIRGYVSLLNAEGYALLIYPIRFFSKDLFIYVYMIVILRVRTDINGVSNLNGTRPYTRLP